MLKLLQTNLVYFTINSRLQQRGDFEQIFIHYHLSPSTADDLQIPEVDIQLRSEAIVAKTRKLKAVWTPELAQDLKRLPLC